MINRAVIDEKKIKAIFKYIDTLNNAKQIKMMFRFNFLCGMRCINFCYLQIKDVLNDDNSVKDIIELTADKNKGAKKAKYYVNDEMKKYIKEYLNDSNLQNRDKFLFTSQKTNKPYKRNSITRIFSTIYKIFNLDCTTQFRRRNNITSKPPQFITMKTKICLKMWLISCIYDFLLEVGAILCIIGKILIVERSENTTIKQMFMDDNF